MHFQAVIFDLDGTLLDTLEDIANAANSTLARQGFPSHEADAYRYFIGDGVTMLAGSNLETGCIAGAGAIITKSFPPFSIVAGNPARLIRMRFETNIIDEILATQWWYWSRERMLRNRTLFEADLSKIKDNDEFRSLVKE